MPTYATPADLHTAWQTLLAAEPNTRIRAAADHLGVSEGELLATQVGGTVTRLNGPWEDVLKRVPELGIIMGLTRNEYVVIEKVGSTNPPEFFSHGGGPSVGQFVGEHIDMRIFMVGWASGFAVTSEVRGKEQLSLQFFDPTGTAVHKIYLRDDSKREVFGAIVKDFTAEDQTPGLEVDPTWARPSTGGTELADKEGFLQGWSEMQDTHQFFHLLRKHQIDRNTALVAGEGRFTWRIPTQTYRQVLDKAAETGLSIMAFVGNPGNIQIHTGPIKKVMEHGSWYNVMDPGFNLHINEEGLGDVWVTEKPTSDGIVSAVEVYDKAGDLAVQFFGERKPGRPELTDWRELVVSLKQRAIVPA